MTSSALRIDRPTPVYERLRTLIIRGRLAPGVRVVENDIAERLGVSRTPAREAVHRLFQEGFLVATPTTRRTELVVAPLTRDDMLDLYEVMATLEGGAARGVATLDAAGRDALVADLDTREEAFEVAAAERKPNYDRLFERHDAFHDRFVHAGALPRMRALIETVRPQVDRYEWVYAPLVGPDHRATFAEHRAIVEAIRGGDADAIQRAVASNWENGAKRLAEVIGEAGARGDW